MSHTLLLIQPNRKLESRTYGDFESLDEALEGVCKIYEEHLKRENPHHASITYDISQVGPLSKVFALASAHFSRYFFKLIFQKELKKNVQK